MIHTLPALPMHNKAAETKRKPLSRKKRKMVADAVELMFSNGFKKNFTVISLAEKLGTNETTLKNAFRQIMKTTIYDFFQNSRMQAAIIKIKEGYSIGEISDEMGYSSIAHFSHAFKMHFGIAPSRYEWEGKD
ncbi:MAG: helix-turn-helix transcriptional regulator [Chitinophagaceae bacterium]|nr:helix-turn-helix transcriptional regulator [Chitinophagaceae bacterium]